MADLPAKTLLEGNKIFTEFYGTLAEQFVLQQMKTAGLPAIAYWVSRSNIAEVDFLIQVKDKVYPVEVKASINLKAKSLKVYRHTFAPTKSIRTSLADFKIDDGLYNIPLYLVKRLEKSLQN
jgi:predicted AAA+ superfamily ATPase